MALLRFASLTSDIELPFYSALASQKINFDKLDDSAKPVTGFYEVRPSDPPHQSCRLQLHGNALKGDEAPKNFYRAEGTIRNFNTIEEYKDLNKTAALSEAGEKIWKSIQDESVYESPSILASFSMVCFADLKKYTFTYLCGFPALQADPAWKVVASLDQADASKGSDDIPTASLDAKETSALVDAVQAWQGSVPTQQQGFFLARSSQGSAAEAEYVAAWQIGPLSQYPKGFFDGAAEDECYICFADPSNYPSYPGWMLRNLLILVRHVWGLRKVQILCYRDLPERKNEPRSIILRLISEGEPKHSDAVASDSTSTLIHKVTGWEKNTAGKVTSRVAKLADYLDPTRLADQAVDLNLKLMKWRIAPDLDLDAIRNSSCLLLGAGTLGSFVARALMAWNVRKITFVDNGTVSFSNPVRQPLYTFEDCLNGGAKKAIRAAESLKQIYPGVESTGHALNIPMIDHTIADEAQTEADFRQLQKLVDEHDILIQLTDTRESRWLPTVMGRARNKIVMNAALGFDSFLVMRHGVPLPDSPQDELGCYFCNDVVAPANSVVDQTLDQQCTVTRPGVSAMASSMLVEILVSLLQSPAKGAAPAPSNPDSRGEDHTFGFIPHQIRGFLSNFQNMVIRGQRYSHCSACSDPIVSAYIKDDWAFVKRALSERGYVEDVSGLTEVQKAGEKAAQDFDLEEEDSGEELI